MEYKNKTYKLIVRTGRDLVFNTYCDDNELIVNLNDRKQLDSYSQKGNSIIIKLLSGYKSDDGNLLSTIELRFVSEIKKVIFDYQEKEQLVFKVEND